MRLGDSGECARGSPRSPRKRGGGRPRSGRKIEKQGRPTWIARTCPHIHPGGPDAGGKEGRATPAPCTPRGALGGPLGFGVFLPARDPAGGTLRGPENTHSRPALRHPQQPRTHDPHLSARHRSEGFAPKKKRLPDLPQEGRSESPRNGHHAVVLGHAQLHRTPAPRYTDTRSLARQQSSPAKPDRSGAARRSARPASRPDPASLTWCSAGRRSVARAAGLKLRAVRSRTRRGTRPGRGGLN